MLRQCENCDQVYIGETERKLETRIQEYCKEVEMVDLGVSLTSSGVPHKSAITDHVSSYNNITTHVTILDHLPSLNDINILQKESDTIRRQILESIWIRKG